MVPQVPGPVPTPEQDRQAWAALAATGGRYLTDGEMAVWGRVHARREADEATWTRKQWDGHFDRLFDGSDAVDHLAWELRRMPFFPAPADDQLRDALLALGSYTLPPPPEDQRDEDDDTVPAAPTLVARLAYLVDLGSDGPGYNARPISARRAGIIRAAMEAEDEHSAAGRHQGSDTDNHSTGDSGQQSQKDSTTPPPKTKSKTNVELLYDLLEEAKQTGKGERLFRGGILASLADWQFNDFMAAVKKAQAESPAGLRVDLALLKRQWRKGRENARKSASADQVVATCVRTGMPAILLSNRQLSDLRAEAITKLREANDPPVIFQRLRELVRFRVDAMDEPFLEALSDISLRGRLADVANFFNETASGHTAAFPPRVLCEEILTYAHAPGTFPVVEAITRAPLVRADGTIIAMPGFDVASRMIYHPPPGFVLPAIPDNPTPAEIEAAKALLLDVLADFSFESAADRANFLGFCLTPLIRALVDVAPLAVFDSPVSGAGKGLLTDVASIIANGEVAAAIPPPATREEWPKLLSSLLDNGRTFVAFDNLHDVLKSDALEAVLTKPFLQFRQLGHTRERIVPNRATWCLTGNNIAVSRDMVRRCFRIRIDPRCAQPHLRTRFKYSNLVDHCKAQRANLLAALLTLIRAWHVAGRPAFGGTPLGTYTQWRDMVGGILKTAGFENFLGNQRTMYSEMDVESEEWENFLVQLDERYPGAEFGVSNVVAMIHAGSISSLPREVAAIYGQTTSHAESKPNPLFAVRLGHILRAHTGTRHGERELYLERGTADRHYKVARYLIKTGVPG